MQYKSSETCLRIFISAILTLTMNVISTSSSDSVSAPEPASSVQIPPAYSFDSRSQAKCGSVSPPPYSIVDLPMISFSLRLSFSSPRMRSANLHDQLDIRSVENNLPLYLLNKCYFDNSTSTFALINSHTNQIVVKATEDIAHLDTFTIDYGHSSVVVLKSASVFRCVYKFSWMNCDFRWSFDGTDLVCVLQSIDPNGRRVNRAIGGIEFDSSRQLREENSIGKVWMFQRAVYHLIQDVRFEPVFLVTSALVMERAGLLEI
ncbi:hypothetical protein K7432_011272 [Basidiobolus ranarum]|uniref:Uncharacterized protein n=1 Tax=Basidiobolus ranarum TaxID=34480 RepID=A0ABR2VUN2_9FUNG